MVIVELPTLKVIDFSALILSVLPALRVNCPEEESFSLLTTSELIVTPFSPETLMKEPFLSLTADATRTSPGDLIVILESPLNEM